MLPSSSLRSSFSYVSSIKHSSLCKTSHMSYFPMSYLLSLFSLFVSTDNRLTLCLLNIKFHNWKTELVSLSLVSRMIPGPLSVACTVVFSNSFPYGAIANLLGDVMSLKLALSLSRVIANLFFYRTYKPHYFPLNLAVYTHTAQIVYLPEVKTFAQTTSQVIT